MDTMTALILLLLGGLIGALATTAVMTRRRIKAGPVVGTLRVDTSDPMDGPYLFLELSQGLDMVALSHRVTLDVRVENYLPPK